MSDFRSDDSFPVKTGSLGHIINIISIIVSTMTYFYSMKLRLG